MREWIKKKGAEMMRGMTGGKRNDEEVAEGVKRGHFTEEYVREQSSAQKRKALVEKYGTNEAKPEDPRSNYEKFFNYNTRGSRTPPEDVLKKYRSGK